MRRINLENINTERDLQVALIDLERRWQVAHNIKDSRRRGKEILRLRGEVKHMLNTCRGLNRSANLNDNNDNSWNRMFKGIARWLGVIERKYKNV